MIIDLMQTVMQKTHVNGPHTDPVCEVLKAQIPGDV